MFEAKLNAVIAAIRNQAARWALDQPTGRLDRLSSPKWGLRICRELFPGADPEQRLTVCREVRRVLRSSLFRKQVGALSAERRIEFFDELINGLK